MNLHIIFVLWLSHVFYPRLNLKFASAHWSIKCRVTSYICSTDFYSVAATFVSWEHILFRGEEFLFLGIEFYFVATNKKKNIPNICAIVATIDLFQCNKIFSAASGIFCFNNFYDTILWLYFFFNIDIVWTLLIMI